MTLSIYFLQKEYLGIDFLFFCITFFVLENIDFMYEFVIGDAVKVLIFSTVSVVYLFFVSKLLGKKQIAQLSFIDYVLGISIGSISAEMATDISDTPIWYYLIGVTVFFLFDVVVSFFEKKSPMLKGFFRGKPTVLIYEGKIDFDNLKKSGLLVNDLIALCREKGFFEIGDIAYAIFETSGELSVLPKGTKRPVVAEDFDNISPSPAQLPLHMVVDGKISFSSLTQLQKDTKWLFKKLNISSKKQLSRIALADFDPQTNQTIIHLKKE